MIHNRDIFLIAAVSIANGENKYTCQALRRAGYLMSIGYERRKYLQKDTKSFLNLDD